MFLAPMRDLTLNARHFTATRNLDLAEDKALPRLAITYGVLRRLGFPEDTVEQCLRSIDGVELEEAIDWVCTKLRNYTCLTHCPAVLTLHRRRAAPTS